MLHLTRGFELEDLFANRHDTKKKYEKRWEALQNRNTFRATPGGRYGHSGRVEMLN